MPARDPDEPLIERLLPPGDPATALAIAAAMRPWAGVAGDRPRVLVNMVATADGRIAIGGRSGPIGGPADHAMFHALRTVVDAVLVGTGTLRAERYGRLVRSPERRAERARLGLAEDPLAILVTSSGDLPWTAPMFSAPEQAVSIVAPPGRVRVPVDVRAAVDVIELPDPSPGVALRAVRHRHGVRAVLCEGGPTLNGALLADGAMDELFLTIGPVLAGGSEALRAVHGAEVAPPAPLELVWVLRHEGELLLRYRVGTTGVE